ncbi:hypothetical protein SCP_0503690 [Sparassis crispa]|uniref:Uncharacterized protein n=1 Tax=Sparassis crispa TaxID=139825 RepID=A0A401GM66_9APHY|nr:hypothetical protein SCP_0503690 [Sparassis crispa]GBE83321.1 hypothetical protein SCP_0503690 [Sparassis crispa]
METEPATFTCFPPTRYLETGSREASHTETAQTIFQAAALRSLQFHALLSTGAGVTDSYRRSNYLWLCVVSPRITSQYSLITVSMESSRRRTSPLCATTANDSASCRGPPWSRSEGTLMAIFKVQTRHIRRGAAPSLAYKALRAEDVELWFQA